MARSTRLGGIEVNLEKCFDKASAVTEGRLFEALGMPRKLMAAFRVFTADTKKIGV